MDIKYGSQADYLEMLL